MCVFCVIPHPAPPTMSTVLECVRQHCGIRPDKCVGAGVFGIVYSGWHSELGPVALKIVSSRRVPKVPCSVLREVGAAAQCAHDGDGGEHVLPVREVLVFDNGSTVMVTPLYVTTLERVLYASRTACLDPFVIQWVFASLARGLGAMHAQGFMHRDVKPANIFVGRVGGDGSELVLGDLGLARTAAEDFAEGSMMSGAAFTVMYAPPEVLEFHVESYRARYTYSADVWSLGIILLQLLAWPRPLFFEDPTTVPRREFYQRRVEPVLAGVANTFGRDTTLHMEGRCCRLALDLLRHVLIPDPAKRWSMARLLDHAYVTTARKCCIVDGASCVPGLVLSTVVVVDDARARVRMPVDQGCERTLLARVAVQAPRSKDPERPGHLECLERSSPFAGDQSWLGGPHVLLGVLNLSLRGSGARQTWMDQIHLFRAFLTALTFLKYNMSSFPTECFHSTRELVGAAVVMVLEENNHISETTKSGVVSSLLSGTDTTQLQAAARLWACTGGCTPQACRHANIILSLALNATVSVNRAAAVLELACVLACCMPAATAQISAEDVWDYLIKSVMGDHVVPVDPSEVFVEVEQAGKSAGGCGSGGGFVDSRRAAFDAALGMALAAARDIGFSFLFWGHALDKGGD